MNRDLKIFLLAVGIPALVIACAGISLIRYEMARERVRQEQRMAEFRERQRERAAEWREKRMQGQQRRREREPERGAAIEPPKGGPPPEGRGPRMRMFSPKLFSPEESVATERILWIGGCMLGLLFLSFGAGGWLLVRSARRAHEEALKKTDFLSNVSHEFKTPLTTICLCAELAQDDGLSPDRRRKALSSILAEANRLKGLVINALDFSRLEKNRRAFSLGPCELAELLREAAEPMMTRFAAHGLVLPEEGPVATADAGAFKQIAVILLDNAAKYAASGGAVEVSFAKAKPGTVRLDFADRGPGLDRDGMKHAFDRFWRGDDATTAETGGSGLGLAIARALARGMGGDVVVAPRPGGGLVFTLELKA